MENIISLKSKNIMICGKKNTGKTHLCKKILQNMDNSLNIIITSSNKDKYIYNNIGLNKYIYTNFDNNIVQKIKNYSISQKKQNLNYHIKLIIDEFDIYVYCSGIFHILLNNIEYNLTNIFICKHFGLIPKYLLKLFDNFITTSYCDDHTAHIISNDLMPHVNKNFLKQNNYTILGKPNLIGKIDKNIIFDHNNKTKYTTHLPNIYNINELIIKFKKLNLNNKQHTIYI